MSVIKTSIAGGTRRGFAAIFSILLSDVILVLLAWCGLAAVISSTPALFNAIKYAGAAYLFYLGVQTIRGLFRPSGEEQASRDAADNAGGVFGRGMLVTLLNPKTLLFYISFFAQFINVQAPHSWMAFIILAAVMFAITFVYFGFLIVQAGETSDAEAFVRELAQRVPQHGDALMTIAQQLEQKGIEKGIQQGEQRGIEKGRSEGERQATLKIARTMLQNGIDRNTVMKMTGLTEDDLAQIHH
ncbi:Leucine efflux protein [Klebsiella grimontii]|nr:Leucine efflux protein [Klebsiella grimontii]